MRIGGSLAKVFTRVWRISRNQTCLLSNSAPGNRWKDISDSVLSPHITSYSLLLLLSANCWKSTGVLESHSIVAKDTTYVLWSMSW